MDNRKLFISHASEDKNDIVEPLCMHLKQNGLQIWYDNDNIRIGNSISQSVVYGLQKYDVFIMILTPSYLNKKWTNFEFGGACTFDIARKKRIIPIFWNVEMEQCLKTYPFLGDIKGIIYNGSLNEVLKTLVKEFEPQEIVFQNLKNQNLIEILYFLRSTNDSDLIELSSLLDQFIQISFIDYESALFKSYKVLLYILHNIEQLKKVELFDKTDGVELEIKRNNILNDNIYQYCDYIISLFRKIEYRGKTHSTISEKHIENIEDYLVNIINWYYNTFYAKDDLDTNHLRIVSSQSFTFQDCITAQEIEKESLPLDMISPPEIVWEWYNYNNQMMHGIRDISSNKLVAFINAIPITESLFNRICQGDYIDVHLPISEVRKFDIPDFYYLYLCSFCVQADYQKTNVFATLYNSFIDSLLELADKEIFIKEVVADAVTDDGIKLCEHIKMEKISNSNHNSSIYKANLLPPNIRLRNMKGQQLASYYLKKYEEFKDIL